MLPPFGALDQLLIPNLQPTLPITPMLFITGFFIPAICGISGRSSTRGSFPSCRPIRSARHRRSLVPRTDADGNDIGGIHVPSVAVPIATYTGWGLRAGNAADPVPIADGCDATGQYIPFPTTAAQRMATGDPTPSLQERYGNPDGTNADYVARVQAAAPALVAQRFLLEEPGIVQDWRPTPGRRCRLQFPRTPEFRFQIEPTTSHRPSARAAIWLRANQRGEVMGFGIGQRVTRKEISIGPGPR
jgi:Alpha/beta hydrolase domain